ncbi:MAG: GNAT family N-acetyltransferase [Chloroflexi bacterium]|uniref:GNAT family N-acetyltransferase n=1 Tax=Candidatus Chlorohelix allophototropha TaxID=3003348 RepID=A0A8T7M7A0_9CHLR|nr:GNAT family N-acetyltransferase [Chloroflexota bacterium]WJW69825.1 GNAT family N-acetyltransferase [Chloroflexota bacterium L227-S17]
MENQPIITTYLQMLKAEEFIPAFIKDSQLSIVQACEPLPAFYRFLYGTVGRDYQWIDRLSWTDHQLNEYLASPNIAIWVAYYRGTPAGYIELASEASEPGTEIVYFGLIPQFHGYGIGKHLLSFGVQRAWEAQPERVWLHTCTLDGKYALNNYLKRGFNIYKEVLEPPTNPKVSIN